MQNERDKDIFLVCLQHNVTNGHAWSGDSLKKANTKDPFNLLRAIRNS